jgi:hypothetical protein
MMEENKKTDVLNKLNIALCNLLDEYNQIKPDANTTTKNNLLGFLDKLSKAYGIVQGNISRQE